MTKRGANATSSAQASGLFSGFERYSTPTSENYQAVMTSGLVVLDTNALLNLYRYTASVRASLLDVLSSLGGQLWEPHQVILEFWARRESAIRDYTEAAKVFGTEAARAESLVTAAICTLGNRIGLSKEQKDNLTEPMRQAFADLDSAIKTTMSAGGAAEVKRDTASDPVIFALEPLLRSRVGAAFDLSEREAALSAARARIESKTPPGYKDASKRAGNAEGDYLVWVQVLREAKSRDCDLLFVTGDTKEDWWRSWGPAVKCAGPRLELLDEFYEETGRQLYMLQPADFLAKASEVLKISITNEEVAEARRFDRAGTPTEELSTNLDVELTEAEKVLLGILSQLTFVDAKATFFPLEEVEGAAAKYLDKDDMAKARLGLAKKHLILTLRYKSGKRRVRLTSLGIKAGLGKVPVDLLFDREVVFSEIASVIDSGGHTIDPEQVAREMHTHPLVVVQILRNLEAEGILELVENGDGSYSITYFDVSAAQVEPEGP